MRSDSTDKWLSNLKTLVQALDLVDPELLPPGFVKDILNPVRSNTAIFDRLSLRNTTYDLIHNITDLSNVAKDRHWFFWEKLSRALARFLRAENCLFFRQGMNGALNKIHPLENVDDKEEDDNEFFWPIMDWT